MDLNMEPPQKEMIAEINLYMEPALSHGFGAFDLNYEPVAEVTHGVIDLNLEPSIEANQDGINLNFEPSIQGRKDTPDEVKKQVYQALLARSTNGKLKKHDTTKVAAQLGVRLRTVQRIWQEGKESLAQGIPVDVSSKKRGRAGRPQSPLDLEVLRNVPLKDRTTLEAVCAILHVSKSKLLRYLKQGLLRRHTNNIKPYLTDANKKSRLQWCVDMLELESIPNNPRFKGLFDIIFIDEKWFYLTRKSERYFLLPDEDDPLRTCKRIFPLVTYEAAKRSSVNQPAGTIEVKPISSITRDVTRDFMIEKVLSAIQAKWAREHANKPIYIQQDNAPSHIEQNDPLFCEAAKQHGFDIWLMCQPANSPDLNILDLGFFHAIQSVQYKKAVKTVQDLVPIVQEAFHEYSPHKANRIYLTYQQVMKEVMKAGGSNNFKIPHMKKDTFERQRCLPVQITCEQQLLADATTKLCAWHT